jgi:hypothetical protein
MGYSTPKKQLDLKEFLSQPATRLPPRNRLNFRGKPTKTVEPAVEKGAKGDVSNET